MVNSTAQAFMRLIDTTTGNFRSINSPLDVPYAILSHTWFPDGEQSYQDILAIQESFREQRNIAIETPQPAGDPSGISCTAFHTAVWTWHLIIDSISALFLGVRLRHTPPSILSRICISLVTLFRVFLVHPLELYTTAVFPPLENPPTACEACYTGDTTHLENPSISTVSILSSPLVCTKLRRACALAREDGYELLWVDSCCIDKNSSAELSEAINSMFEWYGRASVCYVYLADVDDDDVVDDLNSQFRRARWHSRGWTLQELIAPRYLVFFSRNWRPLGTKSTLAHVIEAVTGVDRAILHQERAVHSASVARRMAWAAKRETTRVEDQAYSLLGIFGLHLPTNYGEGRNAFVRLQEAILRAIPDQSIFAWGDSCEEYLPSVSHLHCLLAPSPAAFASAGQVKPLSHQRLAALLRSSCRLHLRHAWNGLYQTDSLHMGKCPERVRSKNHFTMMVSMDLSDTTVQWRNRSDKRVVEPRVVQ